MEISPLANNSLKIRSKQSIILVNPTGKEVPCQGVILFGGNVSSYASSQNMPVIDGPGEYEIGGIKITGLGDVKQETYSMHSDGIDMLLTTASALEKIHSKLKEHQIIILHDGATTLSPTSVLALSPSALLIYGEGGENLAKIFSKGEVMKSNKYSTTLEKLPPELEVVLLAP